MNVKDAAALGREGGLISGRTRRIQGALAGIDSVLNELPEFNDQQRATLIRGLANAIREVQDFTPAS